MMSLLLLSFILFISVSSQQRANMSTNMNNTMPPAINISISGGGKQDNSSLMMDSTSDN